MLFSYQLLEITRDYLMSETEIKIDLDENSKEISFPLLTLTISTMDRPLIREFDETFTLTETDFSHRGDGCLGRQALLPPLSQVIYHFVDCRKSTGSHFLDRILLKKFQEQTLFQIQTEDNNFTLEDMKTVSLSWYSVNAFDYLHIFKRLYMTLTLELNQNSIEKYIKSDNILIKIRHLFNEKRHLSIQNILLHSQPIPQLKEMSSFGLFFEGYNQTIFMSKIMRQYLEHPFGNCSYYRPNSGQLYNAISHMDCYRKCLAYNSIELLGCVPLFIAETIHERDIEFFDKNHCYLEEFEKFTEESNKHLKSKCMKLCPKDCLTVDYHTIIRKTDTNIDEFWFKLPENEKFKEVSLIWDSNQPMFIYREESVMSFADYLCICGGLMGLWFGSNANDMIRMVIESKFWIKLWYKLKIIQRKTKFQIPNKYPGIRMMNIVCKNYIFTTNDN